MRRVGWRGAARAGGRVFALWLVATALLLGPLPGARSLAVSNETREDRLAVFDDAWETIRKRYYDPAHNGVDWLEQRERFRQLAAEARSQRELYATLRRMIGSLKDAHTRVYAPDERFDWQRPRHTSVGLSVREVGRLPVVVSVESASEAERAGLRPGDVIKSLDGEAALDIFAQRLREQTGSSTVAAARLRAMATLFEGAVGSSVKVGWHDGEGKERIATLTRVRRERVLGLTARRVGSLGVIALGGFTPSIAADFYRALKGELRDARGLVLDLRANGGGEMEAMTEVASAFLPAGKNLGRFTDRTGRIRLEPQTRAATVYAAEAVQRVQVPIVILTGEQTSSAAEIFVLALREAGRATVVGNNTCGCVLAIRRKHILPDGGQLDISEMDYRAASGLRLEGAGVAPDERIEVTREDLRKGRDRALDHALALLKRRPRAAATESFDNLSLPGVLVSSF